MKKYVVAYLSVSIWLMGMAVSASAQTSSTRPDSASNAGQTTGGIQINSGNNSEDHYKARARENKYETKESRRDARADQREAREAKRADRASKQAMRAEKKRDKATRKADKAERKAAKAQDKADRSINKYRGY